MKSEILEGKVALVTGAAKGIGKASALALAEAGANIILGLKDKSSGEEVIGQIKDVMVYPCRWIYPRCTRSMKR